MQAKSGDKVKVHYTLKLENEVLESSAGVEPLEFTLGEGSMIPGFESGVIGMTAGEKKTVNIPYAEAYGEHDEKKIFNFPKDKCPEGFEPKVGERVQLFWPDGNPFFVEVVDIMSDSFKMDANHPLAGKDLTFNLELIEIAV
ncbi:MAG: FKBP-type peptidyl-prolyl cis-trans isomerase [Nitrospirae bacterium]|nr:FKBP-type peptidyl-prolyl cis-trans isomerase [Nitrospirota bacterium]